VRNRSALVLLTAILLSGCACFAQQASDTVAPLRANRFTDQVYVGFDHIRTDYALATPDGYDLATTNGVNVEYDMRRKEHLAYIATVRYGEGTPFNQSLITGAAGASYLFHYSRYEPYMHAMGGYIDETGIPNKWRSCVHRGVPPTALLDDPVWARKMNSLGDLEV
jgi:hypothetical protein